MSLWYEKELRYASLVRLIIDWKFLKHPNNKAHLMDFEDIFQELGHVQYLTAQRLWPFYEKEKLHDVIFYNVSVKDRPLYSFFFNEVDMEEQLKCNLELLDTEMNNRLVPLFYVLSEHEGFFLNLDDLIKTLYSFKDTEKEYLIPYGYYDDLEKILRDYPNEKEFLALESISSINPLSIISDNVLFFKHSDNIFFEEGIPTKLFRYKEIDINTFRGL